MEYNIIHKNQYGFQKQANTECAVITIVDYLQTKLDLKDNKVGACIFIDLKKAFDTIPHTLLINKLELMGIRGKFLELCASYLKNRKQFVDLNNISGDTETNFNPFGIPQGSNLGPLFFLLFANEIFNLPTHGKLVLFTDDATLVYVGKDSTDIENKMNHDLKPIHN